MSPYGGYSQEHHYQSRQSRITLKPQPSSYNQYSRMQKNQHFKWTESQQQQLQELVKQYNGNINWKEISYKLGKPINNVQNKYTHMTEANFTQDEKDFISQYWKGVQDSNEPLNLKDLTEKLNKQCSCKHTEKGIQLQLERITERDKSLKNYTKPKEFVNKDLKNKIQKLSEEINDILTRCQNSETYDFVVNDLQNKCSEMKNVIDQYHNNENNQKQEDKQVENKEEIKEEVEEQEENENKQ